MEFDIKKIKFENEEKIFPLTMEEEPRYIVLDSANISRGNSFDNEEERILNYLKEQIKFKDKGTFYNYFISKTGKIYLITERAGNCLSWSHYSDAISVKLPKHCPPYDCSKIKPELKPDSICVTICTEANAQEGYSEDNGEMTLETETSLKELIAYLKYVKYTSIEDILVRRSFPKIQVDKDKVGHKKYSSNGISFVMLLSYAKSIFEKYPNIKVNILDSDVCV